MNAPAPLSPSEAFIALLSAMEEEEFRVALRSAVVQATACNLFSLLLADHAGERWQVYESTLEDAPGEFPFQDDRLARTLQTGQLALTGEEPEPSENLPFAAPAVLPLTFRGETFGLLVLHDPPASPPESLQGTAEQLGVGLVRFQLHEEASRELSVHAAKLSAVAETGELLSQLDLDVLLVKILETSLRLVGAQVGAIVLREEDTWKVGVEWGLSRKLLQNIRLREGPPLIEDVMERNEPDLILQAQQDPRLDLSGLEAKLVSFLCIPLATNKGVLGAACIANASEEQPFTQRDAELLTTIGGMAAIAVENAQLHSAAIENERMRAQLRVAGDIQRALLPHEAPRVPGFQLGADSEPCDDAGGDYYDFFHLENGKLGLTVGDVSGHGVGAALLMATARAFLKANVDREPDPAKLLDRLNKLLEPDMGKQAFMTLFFGVLDPLERTLTYASAGHDPPILLRAGGEEVVELESTGVPLGMFAEFEYKMKRIEGLKEGELLLLTTDGIWEAMDPTEEQFERHRVVEVIRAHRGEEPDKIVQALIKAVKEFCGEEPQRDDLTALAIKVL